MHEDVYNADDNGGKQNISGAPLSPSVHISLHPSAQVFRLNPTHLSIRRK